LLSVKSVERFRQRVVDAIDAHVGRREADIGIVLSAPDRAHVAPVARGDQAAGQVDAALEIPGETIHGCLVYPTLCRTHEAGTLRWQKELGEIT
jgi:hypothetical protein